MGFPIEMGIPWDYPWNGKNVDRGHGIIGSYVAIRLALVPLRLLDGADRAIASRGKRTADSDPQARNALRQRVLTANIHTCSFWKLGRTSKVSRFVF